MNASTARICPPYTLNASRARRRAAVADNEPGPKSSSSHTTPVSSSNASSRYVKPESVGTPCDLIRSQPGETSSRAPPSVVRFRTGTRRRERDVDGDEAAGLQPRRIELADRDCLLAGRPRRHGTSAPIGLAFFSRLSTSNSTPSVRLCATRSRAGRSCGPPLCSGRDHRRPAVHVTIASVPATPSRASSTSRRYGRSFVASFQRPSPDLVSIASSMYLKRGANGRIRLMRDERIEVLRDDASQTGSVTIAGAGCRTPRGSARSRTPAIESNRRFYGAPVYRAARTS